jgi:hypothetical protein
MTIAACYLSAEGVVFGADSTSTVSQAGFPQHLNFAQKIFEIGQQNTLGITMWGLGSLPSTSYRTLIARFSDNLVAKPAATMTEVAERWSSFFWAAYSAEFAPMLQRAQELKAKDNRTPEEESELERLDNSFSGGFCLGGHLLPDRTPQAFETTYAPTQTAPGSITALQMGVPSFWGIPAMVYRLLQGCDPGFLDAILESGKWQGTQEELLKLLQEFFLLPPINLPIREAIDWIHASIHTTIKALKFSHLPPWCGGPVEVAVITTDRPFRWVRHKRFDAAIQQGEFRCLVRD